MSNVQKDIQGAIVQKTLWYSMSYSTEEPNIEQVSTLVIVRRASGTVVPGALVGPQNSLNPPRR